MPHYDNAFIYNDFTGDFFFSGIWIPTSYPVVVALDLPDEFGVTKRYMVPMYAFDAWDKNYSDNASIGEANNTAETLGRYRFLQDAVYALRWFDLEGNTTTGGGTGSGVAIANDGERIIRASLTCSLPGGVGLPAGELLPWKVGSLGFVSFADDSGESELQPIQLLSQVFYPDTCTRTKFRVYVPGNVEWFAQVDGQGKPYFAYNYDPDPAGLTEWSFDSYVHLPIPEPKLP
jgi:hypothetical protein